MAGHLQVSSLRSSSQSLSVSRSSSGVGRSSSKYSRWANFPESRIPATSAVLPSSVWQITNIVISSLVVLFPFAFWATSQLQYATFWQEVLHWSPIHVAAAMLPQGIIALVIGGVAQVVPQIITKPRITIPIAAVGEFCID